jgi:hypothetical protein
MTSTDAKLEALINPNYQETTYDFEYATAKANCSKVRANGSHSSNSKAKAPGRAAART